MPPNNQNNPYGFILNPEKPPKPPLKIFGGNAMIQRAVIVGMGVLLLIIITVFGLSFLNKASNAQAQRLVEIAQTQTEILRVSETTQSKITDSGLAKISILNQLTTRTALKDISDALAKRGQKVNEKLLAKGQNPGNDQVLTEAEQNSTYNQAYRALLSQQLDNYLLQIEAAHSSGSAKEKEMLASIYEQVRVIKDELKS